LKIALGVLTDASFRTINRAQAAFNAFAEVVGRPLGTPVTGAVFSGAARLGDDTAYFKVFPG
jgi:hypothetical protein